MNDDSDTDLFARILQLARTGRGRALRLGGATADALLWVKLPSLPADITRQRQCHDRRQPDGRQSEGRRKPTFKPSEHGAYPVNHDGPPA